jgi:tetratricopeptide (TPR) repeat protein
MKIVNYKNLRDRLFNKGWQYLAIAFAATLLFSPATTAQNPVLEPKEQEIIIRDRVQVEVDRAFNHTTNLLNILILVLILLPSAIAVSLWLLRRTLIQQIAAEVHNSLAQIPAEQKKQLLAEINAECKLQADIFSQEIAQVKSDSIAQISAYINEANAVLTELTTQKSILEQEVSTLKHELSSQFHISPNHLVDMSITEINYHQELIAAEIETPPPILNAQEYLEQGNTHFVAGRYLQANTSYNEAVKLEPNFPEARYQNARSYAMQRRVNLAIGNLQWAIDIDPQHKEMAKTDAAFDGIRADEQFKNLMEN